MKTSESNDRNAKTYTPSVENTHDLRMTALLFDLVEARGRRGAAEVLGVSYGALARAADTGRLSGRMRDALTRHLLGDAPELDEEHQKQLGALERRVAALEEGGVETPEDEEPQFVELRKELTKIWNDFAVASPHWSPEFRRFRLRPCRSRKVRRRRVRRTSLSCRCIPIPAMMKNGSARRRLWSSSGGVCARGTAPRQLV